MPLAVVCKSTVSVLSTSETNCVHLLNLVQVGVVRPVLVKFFNRLENSKSVSSSEMRKISLFVISVDTSKASSNVDSVCKIFGFSPRDSPSNERLSTVGTSKRAFLDSTSEVTWSVSTRRPEESVSFATDVTLSKTIGDNSVVARSLNYCF